MNPAFHIAMTVLFSCCVAPTFGQTASPPTKPLPEASCNATASYGPLEVLTDTMGVDFGPYLQRVVHDVKMNWYKFIPESAKVQRGKLTMEFSILKDGTVAGMRFVATSGEVALDRAAWGGITASNPFPPLPKEFGGQYIALRFTFYYNPDKADLDHPTTPTSSSKSKSGITVSISQPYGMEVPIGGSMIVVATVRGTKNVAVKWSVTGSGCSGSGCGTMSGDLYLAPKVSPSPFSVELTATSEADSTACASVIFQLVQPNSSH
jgi:TonB family protein